MIFKDLFYVLEQGSDTERDKEKQRNLPIHSPVAVAARTGASGSQELHVTLQHQLQVLSPRASFHSFPLHITKEQVEAEQLRLELAL